MTGPASGAGVAAAAPSDAPPDAAAPPPDAAAPTALPEVPARGGLGGLGGPHRATASALA